MEFFVLILGWNYLYSHGKLKAMHSICHMETLNCMVKTINYKMKVIHCKMKTLLHTQSEYNVLKYKVNEATLLPLLLKTKITATKALDGSKKNFKLWRQLNYTFIRK